MRLGDAFMQVNVDLAEAQAIITALARDLRDGNPELHTKIMDAAANLTVPDDAAATSHATSSHSTSRNG